MTRALIFIGAIEILVSYGCAARRSPISLEPYPTLFISSRLPDSARLCVPLEPLRTAEQQVGCVTVGELRASVRGRRTVSFQVER